MEFFLIFKSRMKFFTKCFKGKIFKFQEKVPKITMFFQYDTENGGYVTLQPVDRPTVEFTPAEGVEYTHQDTVSLTRKF